MEIVKDEELKLHTKIWLKAKGFDYAWLAEKCYVSESTVRNWMARRAIPMAKQDIIRRLIAMDPLSPVSRPMEVKAETLISIRISSKIFQRLQDLAMARGLSLDEYLYLRLMDEGMKS